MSEGPFGGQRMDTPWKTENWFVSPWNFLEDVKKDYHPPKKVRIHDVTLRDGEQQHRINTVFPLPDPEIFP